MAAPSTPSLAYKLETLAIDMLREHESLAGVPITHQAEDTRAEINRIVCKATLGEQEQGGVRPWNVTLEVQVHVTERDAGLIEDYSRAIDETFTTFPSVDSLSAFAYLTFLGEEEEDKDNARDTRQRAKTYNLHAVEEQQDDEPEDEISDLPFIARFQTHAGNNEPLGIYTDTAATIPATADGDKVAAWKDELSGSGVVAIRADDAKRPVYRVTGGVPEIEFGRGINAALDTTITIALPATFYWVERTSVEDGNLGATGSAGSGAFWFGYQNSDTTAQVNAGSVAGFTKTKGETKVVSLRFNGAGVAVAAVNGLRVGLNVGGGTGGSNFTIGNIADAYPWQGPINAMLIQDGDASESVVKRVQRYLGSLYGADINPAIGSRSGNAFEIYRPETPNGTLVLYCHGAGETEDALSSDDMKAAMVFAMVNAGYTLACSYAAGNNWGNQAAINAHADLANYVTATYATTKTVVWSQSMGGLAGLNAIGQALIPNLRGWVGIYPVCDLDNVYAHPSFTSDIKMAYGIALDGSDYTALTAGFNPLDLAGAGFTGLPMRFYASPDDTFVSKSANSDAMAAKIAAFASESDVVVCSGEHGHGSHFQTADMLSFLGRCVSHF